MPIFSSIMSAFKTIREFCLVLFEEGEITLEEFILMYKVYESRNPEFPFEIYHKFCLDEMNEAEYKAEFRVEKHDSIFLLENLRIPTTIKCPQRTTCSGLEGLCILLNRLAYPCRFSDMFHRFGRPVPELSMIVKYDIKYEIKYDSKYDSNFFISFCQKI